MARGPCRGPPHNDRRPAEGCQQRDGPSVMMPVDIEPLELSAAIPAGRLIGADVDWRIAQAVAGAGFLQNADARTVYEEPSYLHDRGCLKPPS